MKSWWAFFVCIALVTLGCEAQEEPAGVKLTPSARIEHAPVVETSGLARSFNYPGVFWIHNDSGDGPRLFAVNRRGEVLMPPWLTRGFYTGRHVEGRQPYPGLLVAGATNVDWEAVTSDRDTLYIGDVGNNGNARRDLGVYFLSEPNPLAIQEARPLKWIPVAYPGQSKFPPEGPWHYDCEAMFVYGGKLYFLTKNRPAGQLFTPDPSTSLYRLDTVKTDEVNVLTLVDSRSDLEGWVTGGDISPDGRVVAVLCNYPVQSVWLFEALEGDRFLSGRARRFVFHEAGQAEALCFIDDETILIGNEGQQLFELKVSDFVPVER